MNAIFDYRRKPMCLSCPRLDGMMQSESDCPRDANCYRYFPLLDAKNTAIFHEIEAESPIARARRKPPEPHAAYFYWFIGERQRVTIWPGKGDALFLWFLDKRVFVPWSQCPAGAALLKVDFDQFWKEEIL